MPGAICRDLFRDRLLADYSLPVHRVENVEFARVAVESAREVQNLIESCDTNEAIAEIKAGIAEYERRISGG